MFGGVGIYLYLCGAICSGFAAMDGCDKTRERPRMAATGTKGQPNLAATETRGRDEIAPYEKEDESRGRKGRDEIAPYEKRGRKDGIDDAD